MGVDMTVPCDGGVINLRVGAIILRDGIRETFRWVTPDEPGTLYPEFFREELRHPADHVKHFMTDEREGIDDGDGASQD